MKGIIVFNDLNDVLYFYGDKEFKTHVNSRALEDGLISEQQMDDPVDTNVVMQLFSPMVASQRFMISQMGNPYYSIECGDGLLFVFEQFNDLLQVAINGDGTESKEFLHRKLLVFQRLLTFLFGPVHEELRPDRVQECRIRWVFLTQLLSTWQQLYDEEQGFLIEAVERLHVNQTLNAKCIELLEYVMMTMKLGGEKNVLHAMLIVNAKLLAFYSGRNASDLQASDILLMIVLIRTVFPTNQKLEDLFSHSYPYPVGHNESHLASSLFRAETEQYESASSGQESEEVEFFSTPGSSPNLNTLSRSGMDPNETKSTVDTSISTDQSTLDNITLGDQSTIIGGFSGVNSLKQATAQQNEPEIQRLPEFRTRQQSNQSNSSFYSTQADDLLLTERDPYQKFTVLLGTASCRFTPHTLHCIEILPGTVLIVACEVSRAKHVGAICHILTTIRTLAGQSGRDVSQNKNVIESVESNFKKIVDVVKKLKGPPLIERTMAACLEHWNQIKKNGLADYLRQPRRPELPPRLESCMTNLLNCLKVLFRRLYLTPWKTTTEAQLTLNKSVEDIRLYLQSNLTDYQSYLDVKAQRNITITSYVEEFPGLVHFVYVDRMSHQMMAPSINISDQLDEESNSLIMKIKDKLWSQFVDIQTQLKRGHFWQSVHRGDLLFCYYIWFEDTSGGVLHLHHPFRGCPDHIMPGILAGNFYRQIVKQCLPTMQSRLVNCYELLTVHVGLVPNQFAQSQCRKLAQKLWEIGDWHYSPVSLL